MQENQHREKVRTVEAHGEFCFSGDARRNANAYSTATWEFLRGPPVRGFRRIMSAQLQSPRALSRPDAFS